MNGAPNAAIDIGNRRELFVDRLLIDRLDNTQLRLHEPISGGVAICIDRPWEGPANGPQAVFRHNDRYHLYYRALRVEPGQDSGVLSVATSEDGLHWTKPALGLVEHLGDGDTNIVADEDGALPMSTPWLDTRPGVPDDDRIKAIFSQPISGEEHTAFKDPAGPKRLVFWGSADGFNFRKLDPQPDLVSDLRNCFDGGNTMFWSEAEQQYVLYYRWYDGEWGKGGRRSMAKTTSKDLLEWSESEPMTYGDTPREQFYTNSTHPYFRAPHIYIAPAARFMEGRRVVTDEQVEAIGLKESHGYFYGDDCSDAVLLTSRAGTTQYDRTFMETFIRPGLGPSNWVTRTNYPLAGILPFGTEQVMLFVSRHYMQDSWHIERLLLRADGFASISAPWAGGEMLTKPFTFTGSTLEINYRTGAPGFIRVEVQDAGGAPVPEFTLDDCPEIIGDEIERLVAWKQGTDVSRLAGQSIRLRFVMKDADLFALRFE
ncbi:MAG: hypothetical protein QF886_00440 [Planctomycetota bacterium]|nr:hypothetical protein [Planctomycetota bacterium]